MSSSELDTLPRAFRAAGGKWSTVVIWAKNTFTLGRADYQRQYEPILYGWNDGTDHYWCGARDIVLDPFGGSGSTLIACEKSGRQARRVELDPKYCDVIVQRWQEWAGGNGAAGGQRAELR